MMIIDDAKAAGFERQGRYAVFKLKDIDQLSSIDISPHHSREGEHQ